MCFKIRLAKKLASEGVFHALSSVVWNALSLLFWLANTDLFF
jgi:hypothetical protein